MGLFKLDYNATQIKAYCTSFFVLTSAFTCQLLFEIRNFIKTILS